MREKNFFVNLNNIGTLHLDEILFEYEWTPILCALIDDNNNYYMGYCTEFRKESTLNYVVTKVSIKTIIDMLQKNISIAQSFHQDNCPVYEVEQKYIKKDVWEDTVLRIVPPELIDEELPEKDLLFRSFTTYADDYLDYLLKTYIE